MMLAVGLPLLSQTRQGATAEIPTDVLEDKIRGGFFGQIVGDLNGLKHEMKYILEPGSVQEYTPGLPDGGWTDDDTDIAWPYLVEMHSMGVIGRTKRCESQGRDHHGFG